MISHALVLTFVLASLHSISYAQDASTFIFPAGKERFSKSDTLNATFFTTRPEVTINGFCITDPGRIEMFDSRTVPGNQGHALMSFNKIPFPSSFCWLHFNAEGNVNINSESFRVFDQTRAATTVGPSAPTTSSSSSACPAPTLSGPASGLTSGTTPTPSIEPSSGPALSTGAVAGISIACAVVAIGLGAFGGIFWGRRHQRRLDGSRVLAADYQQMVGKNPTLAGPTQPSPAYRWEMPPSKPPVELSDSSLRGQ